MYWPEEDESVKAHFDADMKDVHLLYDYAAKNPETGERKLLTGILCRLLTMHLPSLPSGADEKWEYEMWFYNENRIVYAIHGGPMAGRINFQTADYQCIRPGELWQCNWLEGGSVVSGMLRELSLICFVTRRDGHSLLTGLRHPQQEDYHSAQLFKGTLGASRSCSWQQAQPSRL